MLCIALNTSDVHHCNGVCIHGIDLSDGSLDIGAMLSEGKGDKFNGGLASDVVGETTVKGEWGRSSSRSRHSRRRLVTLRPGLIRPQCSPFILNTTLSLLLAAAAAAAAAAGDDGGVGGGGGVSRFSGHFMGCIQSKILRSDSVVHLAD
ncbi:hypothetical protein PV325_000966 [Microctonus aethiopoides]|nr:hypothetical protein PV325_000966 [Microctonus aethiopoides]